MEMKKQYVGLSIVDDFSRPRHLVKHKRTGELVDGRQKNYKKRNKEIDYFRCLFSSNSHLKHKVDELIKNQPDFYLYEDVYVRMKWEILFGSVSSFLDQFDDKTQKKINSIYQLINPYSDLQRFF